MQKQSIKAQVRAAKSEDARLRKPGKSSLLNPATHDSFVNFAHKLGIGADNALTTSTYGYNPITRNRTQLEWIHRGSWLGGVAIDLVADDMTRAGVDIKSQMDPLDQEVIEHEAINLDIWGKTNEVIKWGRLYGGSLGVLLVDGQDMNTPLRLETVGAGQFRGIACLDRWQVEPSLEDLVMEMGPHMGLPKYYRVQSNAAALRGKTIHHSRVAFRMEGVQLPYQQRMTENLWGLSVLERLYDRMIAFDSASTGAAQLVHKSFLRTLKIEGFRDIVSAGGTAMNGVLAYTEIMRRFQGIEGITLVDAADEFEVQGHSAFSGLGDALTQFGQQLSGALQIPLVRLFGQSPAGLNSSGESDLRMFYDHIRQQQRRHMIVGITTVYKLMAQSLDIKLPKNFRLDFTSLLALDDTEKANHASTITTAVSKAFGDGLIGRQTALKELYQASAVSGVFSNITQESIDSADDEVAPPELDMGEFGNPASQPASGNSSDLPGDDNEAGPKREKDAVDTGTTRRIFV